MLKNWKVNLEGLEIDQVVNLKVPLLITMWEEK